MARTAFRVPVLCLCLFLAMSAAITSPARATQAPASAGALVYHQITDVTSTSGTVGDPVLSADGSVAVFADAPGSDDPETPNRIFTVGADGAGLTEVDAYVPLCF